MSALKPSAAFRRSVVSVKPCLPLARRLHHVCDGKQAGHSKPAAVPVQLAYATSPPPEFQEWILRAEPLTTLSFSIALGLGVMALYAMSSVALTSKATTTTNVPDTSATGPVGSIRKSIAVNSKGSAAAKVAAVTPAAAAPAATPAAAAASATTEPTSFAVSVTTQEGADLPTTVEIKEQKEEARRWISNYRSRVDGAEENTNGATPSKVGAWPADPSVMPPSKTEHTPVATERTPAAADASDATSLEKAGNAGGNIWTHVMRMLQRVWDMIASLFGKKSGDDAKAVPASS